MFYNKELVSGKLRKWEKYLRNYTLPSWDELPNIDLYMDQVIGLLTQYLEFLPHGEYEEKVVVTASAINNYVRTKIMPAPIRKKYSKIHIAYLIMICTLKQSLNIAYVQKMIPMGLNIDAVKAIYDDYVQKHKLAAMYFIGQVKLAAARVLDKEDKSENAVENLVSAAAVISGFAKLLAEKLIVLQETDQPELQTQENLNILEN